MKTNKLILFFLLSGLLFLLSCKKVEKEMLVSTGTVTNILTTTADVSGKILDLGQGATQYGHCYSKTSNPTIDDTKIDHSSPSLGDFTSTLEGLDAGTKYYVKAYLSRGKDAVYGNEISFTTAAATLPTVTTIEATSITKNSAVSGGNITDEGGTPVKERGVCWSLATITTLTNNKTTNGPGTGAFNSDITGLTSGTKYFVRAYATNSGGTKLGNEVTFTTTSDTPVPPTVTTTEVNSVTSNSAISGGNVTSEGSSSVIARGVCWNTSPNPKISDSKTTNGSGSGSFVSNLTSLSPGTTYYVRAYATNSAGTSYADAIYEYSFTTICIAPSAMTNAASSIGNAVAILNGTVNANGFSTTISFDYGLTTSYGNTVTASQSPVTGSSNTAVSAGITSLTPNSTYHFRVKAINCEGTPVYGNDQQFITSCIAPVAATNAASGISNASAILNGTVNANGFSTTVSFDYGLTTSYGSTATASQSPLTGSSNTAISVGITSLTPNSIYHFRVKAINCEGTAIYGNDQQFLTNCIAPVVSTNTASDIGYATATLNGTVNANGFSTTVSFDYGLTTSYGNTATASQSPLSGSINTAVSAGITGLTPNSTYHFRVKAINCEGTAIYGNDQQFLTSCIAPVASTNAASSISNTTATLNGTVNANGLSTTVSFDYGLTTSYGSTATASQSPLTGSSNMVVSAGITGLAPNSTYHFRVKAINCEGTPVYGTDQQFITNCTTPSATTNNATGISSTTATLNGTVNANNFSTDVTFGYGLTTSYGSTATAVQSPLTGSSNASVSIVVNGLSPNTVYHFRIKTVNCGGTIFGLDQTLTTLCATPSATTNDASNLGNTTATLNGTVNANANGCSTTITFEYGTTTSYGASVTADQSPVNGLSPTPVNAVIPGLLSGQTYHYRVKGTSAGGTSNGDDKTFTTTVADKDGNVYNIVAIGTQVWMKENLKTTKYKDGTDIPLVTDLTEWSNLTTPGYSWYYNDAATYKNKYGALYNGFTVTTDKLCPSGWHVPTDIEWTTLTTYLGGESIAGSKLKEAGTSYWDYPNTGATNETNFTALPGGYRVNTGTFSHEKTDGTWWSSSEFSSTFGWFRQMNSSSSNVYRINILKSMGLSVRCVRD
jgi:uncharacterized protein (TIGR02145 family)